MNIEVTKDNAEQLENGASFEYDWDGTSLGVKTSEDLPTILNVIDIKNYE